MSAFDSDSFDIDDFSIDAFDFGETAAPVFEVGPGGGYGRSIGRARKARQRQDDELIILMG